MDGSFFRKSIHISINKSWYSKNIDRFPDPLGSISDACKSVFPEGAEVVKEDGLNCRMTVNTSISGAEQIVRIIKGVAKDTLALENVAEAVTVTFVPERRAEKTISARLAIQQLIGAQEFKQLAQEIASIAPQIKKYSTYNVFASQSYLFSINDGCGLSTYIKLFAGLVDELGIFELRSDRPIVEIKLSQRAPTDAPDTFMGELADFKRKERGSKGVIYCIDISEWMSMTDEKPFRDMLAMLERHTADNIFIFRIPFVEADVLHNIKDVLSDLLYIRDISFLPLDTVQLRECAKLGLSLNGYSMEDDSWEIFDARIAEEKRDGRFYGINTVRKIVNEMIYRKQLCSVGKKDCCTVISRNDMAGLSTTFTQRETSAADMLSELIGMEKVAERITEIVSQIKVAVSKKNIASPCLHMQFIGNPGTGKTTVARIVGKMLKENGVLRNGGFFEYGGRDLCGKFIGETAPKTAGICRDAYGSVLFIDEAYSLYRGSDDHRDFGMEALETLIAEMENHRSDLVVIMAGYGDEMKTLMQGNPGLKSRMPYVVEFPNYTGEQLFEIFRSMLDKSFPYDERVLEAAREHFCSIPESVLTSKEFSNARFVRNLFERTWGKAAMRCRFSGASEITVTKEDFLQAVGEKDFDLSFGKRRPFGFR